MISKTELMHHKLQAILRENDFTEKELSYLGKKDGQYWYIVSGIECTVDEIESFEPVDV